jgi:hypothetical protein
MRTLGKRLVHDTHPQEKTQLKRSKDNEFKNQLGDRRLNFLQSENQKVYLPSKLGKLLFGTYTAPGTQVD